MSQPTLWLPIIKQYEDGFTIPSMIEAKHAGYISFPDYLNLKAENERLHAKNERLLKAGDAMSEAIRSIDHTKPTCHAKYKMTEAEYIAVTGWDNAQMEVQS